MPIILSIPCRPPRVIYYIYSGSWNKIRCLFIGIHEFLGSLASSSDHWRTCKFASHSDVSTISFTDRSSKFNHSNLPGSRSILSVSIWIRLASSSATASSCQSWLCPTQNKGWENPPADLDEATQVPLQRKVLTVVDMIATMLQWRVSYRSTLL